MASPVTAPPPGFVIDVPAPPPGFVIEGAGSADDNMALSSRQKNFDARSEGEIDTETGAPAQVRALVGAVDKKQDRLATLRKFYPDAIQDVVDPENFLFTNPETKKVTLFNPSGLDIGDAAGVGREASQMVGGTIGTVLGSAGGLPGAAVGGVLGTGAGEELFNLGAQALGAEDTRSLGQRAKDTATIAAGGLAGPVSSTSSAAVKAGTRGAIRGGEAGRQGVQDAVDDLAKFGATPSLAQATQKTLLDSIESIVAKIPGGAGRIRSVALNLNEKIGEGIERRALQLTGRSSSDAVFAGTAIKKGVEDYGLPLFKDKADVLFKRIDQFAPKKAKLTNTKAVLERLGVAVPELPATSKLISSPGVTQLREALMLDLNIGGATNPSIITEIPFPLLQKIRSTIGRRLTNSTLIDDIPKGDLKQIYAAVSQDMRASLANSSDPAAAHKAFLNANKFYTKGLQRFEDFVEPLVKKVAPEKVFETLMAGGKSGPTQIEAMRKSVGPDVWRTVVGTQVRRLGQATPGAAVEAGEFSVDRFLTNWNTVDAATKKALFRGKGLGSYGEDLEALARASGRIRESSQAFRNPSGTAGAMAGVGMALGGAAGGVAGAMTTGSVAGLLLFPAALGLLGMSANGAARLLTNPKVVKWMAQSTKINPKGFSSHLGRLAGIATTSDTETRRSIQEFLTPYQDVGLKDQPRVTNPR